MENVSKVAIVALSALESAGIKSFFPSTAEYHAETFADTSRLKASGLGFELFVVSEGEFAGNFDFYVPRKGKTIIISRESGIGKESSTLNIVWSDSTSEELWGMMARIFDSPEEERGLTLSQREREVLSAVASGKTNKEIADALCISVNTVITHRKNLTSKLGIRSTSGLSLYAAMNGLI